MDFFTKKPEFIQAALPIQPQTLCVWVGLPTPTSKDFEPKLSVATPPMHIGNPCLDCRKKEILCLHQKLP